MAASVEVRIHHGAAPGLGSDVTGQTLRLKRADDDTQDALFPVPIPSVGLNYSWRKVLRLIVVTAPDNQVSNLRFFSDGGSPGAGRRVLFARSVVYTQPTVADETTAIGTTDVTTKTSGSPESIQPGELCNSGDVYPLAAGGASSQDYVELQLEVGPTALVGTGGALTMRYRYNES